MIRLTEVERKAGVVLARIEGHLTHEALHALNEEARGYHATGLEEVGLLADGLRSVGHRVAEGKAWPDKLRVCLATHRVTLQDMLAGHGLDVELLP